MFVGGDFSASFASLHKLFVAEIGGLLRGGGSMSLGGAQRDQQNG